MDDTNGFTHKATCRFTVSSWDESVVSDIDGEVTTTGEVHSPRRGISRSDVAYSYAGDVEGTSQMAYLFGYRGGDDLVLGLERFTGTIDGHAGSCVLQHTGSHDASGVRAHVRVVEGMGTGELTGLRGEAELEIVGHSEDGYELVLRYDLG